MEAPMKVEEEKGMPVEVKEETPMKVNKTFHNYMKVQEEDILSGNKIGRCRTRCLKNEGLN